MADMIVSGEDDKEISDDSDEDKETRYNLLEDGCGQDMIEEEEEGADCDDCIGGHGGESSEELPFIKDVDRSKFKRIDLIEQSDEESAGEWESSQANIANKMSNW
jgi:hypothetical protein